MSNSLKSTYIWIVAAILLAVSIRVLIIGVYKIPTISMLPTLVDGDIVLSNKLAYLSLKPKVNDVVVFTRSQKLGQYYIKRIVAEPGDTIVLEKDRVLLNQKLCLTTVINTYENFEELEEKCDNENSRFILKSTNLGLKSATRVKLTLGADEYFVLGDNRDVSEDSRDWGVVKTEQIQGQVFLVVLSFPTTQDSISSENKFWHKRFLTKIK